MWQRWQERAPNVEVTSSAGDPGAGAYIRIREANSLLGANQPLMMVDGQPIDNSSRNIEDLESADGGGTRGTVISNRGIDLNPNDIESVEILKGAAASAIYGSRAANGVVLITTKSGSPGVNEIQWRSFRDARPGQQVRAAPDQVWPGNSQFSRRQRPLGSSARSLHRDR